MKQYFDNKETNRRDSIFYGSFKNQLPQIFSGEIRLLSITAFIPALTRNILLIFWLWSSPVHVPQVRGTSAGLVRERAVGSVPSCPSCLEQTPGFPAGLSPGFYCTKR